MILLHTILDAIESCAAYLRERIEQRMHRQRDAEWAQIVERLSKGGRPIVFTCEQPRKNTRRS